VLRLLKFFLAVCIVSASLRERSDIVAEQLWNSVIFSLKRAPLSFDKKWEKSRVNVILFLIAY
jgi:hypothetical protein